MKISKYLQIITLAHQGAYRVQKAARICKDLQGSAFSTPNKISNLLKLLRIRPSPAFGTIWPQNDDPLSLKVAHLSGQPFLLFVFSLFLSTPHS
jgi:hypothetical protein